MNSRELVLDALNHRQPARIPIDFSATPTSGIHVSVVEALRAHYGLPRQAVKVWEPYQMLGEVEEDLKQAMGIDVEGVPAPSTIFGFPNTNWQSWRTPWGQEVQVSEHFRTTTDATGDVFIYPQGDTAAPASGHMPRDGYFFDSIIRQPALNEEQLDPLDNLEEFSPISTANLDYFRRETARARRTGRAVIANFGGTGLGDIALVPAPFLKNPRGIRDIEEWYISVSARPDYVHAIFDRQTTLALENLAKLKHAVGDNVDAVFLCGTDFGTQTSSFCSVDTFASLYQPYYRRMTQWIHTNTPWKVFKHSCGAVEKFIPSFIDTGFDILNPVQCSATGMDPLHLKQAYGSRITFWGGGVDTQHVLPFGSPERVRQQVRERCQIFSPCGGFVFNTIHNIQARTPVDNLVAMLETVHAS